MRHKTSVVITVEVAGNRLTRYFDMHDVCKQKDFISWSVFLPSLELDMLAELCESIEKSK